MELRIERAGESEIKIFYDKRRNASLYGRNSISTDILIYCKKYKETHLTKCKTI